MLMAYSPQPVAHRPQPRQAAASTIATSPPASPRRSEMAPYRHRFVQRPQASQVAAATLAT